MFLRVDCFALEQVQSAEVSGRQNSGCILLKAPAYCGTVSTHFFLVCIQVLCALPAALDELLGKGLSISLRVAQGGMSA